MIRTFAIACLVTAATYAADFSTQDTQRLAIIAQWERDHDNAAARRALLALTAEAPGFALPRYHLGVLAGVEGNTIEAVSWYDEFLLLQPDSPLAPEIRIYLEKLRPFAKRQTLSGTDLEAYHAGVRASRAALKAGSGSEALNRAAEALAVQPRGYDALVCLAGALALNGDAGHAAAALQLALESAPPGRVAEIEQFIADGAEIEQLSVTSREIAETVAKKDWKRAAALHAQIWEADKTRTDHALRAAKAHFAAGERTRAQAILRELQAGNAPGDIARLISITTQLGAGSSASGTSISTVKSKSRSSKAGAKAGSSGGSGSLSGEFLKRVK